MGGDPLLTLLAVDWFQVDKPADRIALHPKCLVQVYLLISPYFDSLPTLMQAQLVQYCNAYLNLLRKLQHPLMFGIHYSIKLQSEI